MKTKLQFSESRGVGLVSSMNKHVARLNFSLLACFCLAFSGCETYQAVTTGRSFSVSGTTGVVDDDQIVVRTEQSLVIALDTFDLFLKLERQNTELFAKIPGAHGFAENVRRNGKKWIDSAKVAKQAYKYNRTAANWANLRTASKTLQAGIEESKKYIAQKGN